jgi:hypothetical protein
MASHLEDSSLDDSALGFLWAVSLVFQSYMSLPSSGENYMWWLRVCVDIGFLFQMNHRWSMPVGTVGRESCQMATLIIMGYKRPSSTFIPTRHNVA